MTTAWIDLRQCKADLQPALVEAAIGNNIEGVVFNSDSIVTKSSVTSALKWVAILDGNDDTGSLPGPVDIVVRHFGALEMKSDELSHLTGRGPAILFDVRDKQTLDEACASVRAKILTLVRFKDPTKIPLEIVLAAGANRNTKVMTFVANVDDAKVVASVLESGPDGVIMKPDSVADVAALGRLCEPRKKRLVLKEFEVTSVRNVGTGDRVCVDTCSNFGLDEGILVGSFGGGYILCCSETHPLPYMKTRPFRVNAGSVNSYVLSSIERTNYLSELCQGDSVMGVSVNGETRELTVGRAKIETRPLILVQARTADGETASIILQNDWHVRVLGPGGAVLNVTELKPGSVVIGHATVKSRHVGMPIEEFCLEQ